MSGDKGQNAELTPVAGSVVAGTAYRAYRGSWGLACAAIMAVWQDYTCADVATGACVQDATTSMSSYPCEGAQIHPCFEMPACAGSGSTTCHHVACTDYEGGLDNANSCSSCAPTPGVSRICDSRTAPMIAAGCAPCALAFQNGGVVTVTDSKGRSASAVVTA